MKKMFCRGKNDSSSSAVYGLGMIGAVVYYVQNSVGFWGVLIALFKGILWPAFVVYDFLSFIH